MVDGRNHYVVLWHVGPDQSMSAAIIVTINSIDCMLSGSRGTLRSSLVGQKALTLGRKVSRNSNSTLGTHITAFCDGSFFLTLQGAPATHHLWSRRSQDRRHFALACMQSACCPFLSLGCPQMEPLLFAGAALRMGWQQKGCREG